jgi:hypothetical protein
VPKKKKKKGHQTLYAKSPMIPKRATLPKLLHAGKELHAEYFNTLALNFGPRQVYSDHILKEDLGVEIATKNES